jgi:hypothetical protein
LERLSEGMSVEAFVVRMDVEIGPRARPIPQLRALQRHEDRIRVLSTLMGARTPIDFPRHDCQRRERRDHRHTGAPRISCSRGGGVENAAVPKVKVVAGGRIGYAEDVTDVVGWLVSEKAGWVIGSVVTANRGAEWVRRSSYDEDGDGSVELRFRIGLCATVLLVLKWKQLDY